jgi:hypothetical protein
MTCRIDSKVLSNARLTWIKCSETLSRCESKPSKVKGAALSAPLRAGSVSERQGWCNPRLSRWKG